MGSKPLDVIFMGTPEFAVPSLKALTEADVRIRAVVTQPDRRRGRGRKLLPPPVKETARALDCEILQPETAKSDDFYEAVAGRRPDLLVVVAYGQILPKRLLELPPLGAVNVHASILPKYRGPAPIQWAIINGEPETGVTTMQMDAGLDTGEILMTSKTAIYPDDTAGTLHDRLSRLGGWLLQETISGLQHGTLQPAPQDHGAASYAPLLKKSDGRIDWREPAAVIERKIRGMNPWPVAHTFYKQMRLNIFRGEVRPAADGAMPGTVIPGFTGELRVAAGEGAVSILELQGESGKRMQIQDFLSGTPVPEGSRLQ